MTTTVVLATARTDFERATIADWAATSLPGSTVLAGDDYEIDDLDGATRIVPVRVTWLPELRDGERRAGLADVLTLTNPRRPHRLAQERIARSSPDRVRVVPGDAATVADLRKRHAESGQAEPFAQFVKRQAVLATERAERQIVGDRYKVPRLVAEQIAASPRFRERAAELAKRLGRPAPAVVAEATDKLSGFVAVQSAMALDLLDWFTKKFHEKAWTVEADVASLDRLRELNREHGLVFLPSHRSYVDPRILAEVLNRHDFPPNHLLGGQNMQLPVIGQIARRAGVIFIRRSFSGDDVYRFAMREYLSYLVEKRFNLEWYLEGGRSRTGKLRPPMYGLLAYVVDAVASSPDTDVMVVPTSIVYDRLPEVNAMAAEAAGNTTKKAESLGWLVKYAKAQRTEQGEAHVRFAPAFSLRAALEEAGEGPARLEKVAFKVLDGINSVTPISATSLATFALLGAEHRGFTEPEVEHILRPLLDYFRRRDLPGPPPASCRGVGLRATLTHLQRAAVLTSYDGGTETVWSVAPGNHAVAAFYRNGAIHHLVNRAILELALAGLATGAIDTGQPRLEVHAAAAREVLRIRDLLKFEFFFPPKTRHLELVSAELDLLLPGWQRRKPTARLGEEVLRKADVLVARRTLQPFLDAQLVVASQLVALGDATVDKEPFVESCLGVGQQLLLQREILAPDAVSKELFGSALKLAANRELLERGVDVGAARTAFLDEVTELRTRLGRIAAYEKDLDS